MKLFWKLLCSMVLIATAAFALGGYLLIDGQFHSSLEGEAETLFAENDLLRYTLSRELGQFSPFSQTESLAERVEGMKLQTAGRAVSFRLAGEAGELAQAGTFPPLPQLGSQLPRDSRGWRLLETENGKRWLHAASPLTLNGETVFLENCREVSGLFEHRAAQYHSFFYLMLGLIGAVGALSLAVSRVMLAPLGRLSAATKRMAAGELDVRVRARGGDELAALSADFNAMAGRLKEQMEELRSAARRQEDFMGAFAHEIKTPLTSIIGYADLLRSRPVSQEELRAGAGYIFSEGRRLESMSRKLMDLIVLDRRDFPLHPVSMERFLGRVAGAMRPALEGQGVTLKTKLQAAEVPLEQDLMETVVLNLLDNARKAVDRGGRIQLEGMATPWGYQIRVTDDGGGIPAEDLGRVTEAFYMVDKSRARAKGGAGLGLALCSRVVALHGGSMDIESVPGQGTAVTVTLRGGEEL